METPKPELQKWEQQIDETKDWKVIRDGLEVKLCAGPDGAETFVLCRSADRRKKEEAMHRKFSEHIEEALQSLRRRLERRKRKEKPGNVERQIGRLFQRNSRAAAAFDVKVVEDEKQLRGLLISGLTNVEWKQWADATESCYILRTNIADWTPIISGAPAFN